MRATTRSAAWAASRSRAISSASLTIRRSRSTVEARRDRHGRPEGRLEPEQVHREQRVRDRDRGRRAQTGRSPSA